MAATALSIETLAKLPREKRLELVGLLEEKDRRARRRRFYHLFPDETRTWRGDTFHARHLYAKHLEFFEVGATHRERCMMAANRVGKTYGAGYELTCHLPH